MVPYLYSIQDIMGVAESKVGIEGWQGVSWERVGEDSVVAGCVPDGVYSRGPRKGKPRYSKPVAGTSRKVVVVESEIMEHASRYESEENNCWDCKGSGEVFHSWDHKEGTTYRKCKRCDGSGKPS